MGTHTSTPHTSAPSACLSEAALLALAENRLPNADAALAHIAQCPLCSDALEGIRFMEEPERLSPLVASLNQKIALKASSSGGGASTKFRPLWSPILAVAACLVIGFFAIWQLPMGNAEMALESPREEKSAASSDSMLAEQILPEKEAQSLKAEGKLLEKPVVAKEQVAPVVLKQGEKPDARSASIPAVVKSAEEDLVEEVYVVKDVELPKAEKMLAKEQGDGGEDYPPVMLDIYESQLLTKEQNLLLGSAQASFNGAKFAQAAHLYDKLLEEVPNSMEVNYLAGLNLLYQNQPQQAVRKFKAIARSSDAYEFSKDVDWPLIISLLNNNQIAEAEALLKSYRLVDGKLVK